MFDQVYLSEIQDPYVNLSLEQRLLEELVPNERRLLIYINQPCVVIGRFQNPLQECDLSFMKEQGIDWIRRQSGGGTVYHDLGNINLCFLNGARELQKADHQEYLVKVLRQFDFHAKISGRSDVLVEYKGLDYKISGSAFKQKRDRSFHHATLLYDADKAALKKCLAPKLKIQNSRSIPSNPHPTINLKQITPQLELSQLMTGLTQGHTVQNLDAKTVLSMVSTDYLQSLKTWEWKWGEIPVFDLHHEGQVISFQKAQTVDGIKINEFLGL
ncbi:MAG: hypothetical protein JNM93_06795 [Bacteriovoracaceae bacterium]|nr:hypothetical protein [Bacteriovoracaceae bacterium]